MTLFGRYPKDNAVFLAAPTFTKARSAERNLVGPSGPLRPAASGVQRTIQRLVLPWAIIGTVATQSAAIPCQTAAQFTAHPIETRSEFPLQRLSIAWDEYLDRLAGTQPFDLAYIAAVRQFWSRIVSYLPTFSVPLAGPTGDGTLELVWDRQEHHLDIEIMRDGVADWFYRNRSTGETIADTVTIGEESERLLRVAGYFSA